MFQLTEKDQQQLNSTGISTEKFHRYLEIFSQGIPFSEVCSAANVGNGIIQLSQKEFEDLARRYDENTSLKVVKFTPASGAATRMFKAMHQLMASASTVEEFSKHIEKEEFASLKKMGDNLSKLPFYQELLSYIHLPEQFSKKALMYEAFKTMIESDKLGLADLPKGLIPFHSYEEGIATAFEEHFYEAARYASKNGKAHLHFTISEEHQDKFKAAFVEIQPTITKETGVEFTVSFSFQKKSTDTLAVDLQNQPFRLNNGELLFRPGGHGALIENLNEVEADIIFIKNIDNIAHRKNLDNNAFYKKALAGYVLIIQEECFKITKVLENNPTESTFEEARDFLKTKLNIVKEITSTEQALHYLNKPIRVCGMVKNEGEPGGGPYWMLNGKGENSLQIVEKSQINLHDPAQEKILQEATHFNPVDLVCGVRNHKGEKFNLLNYINPDRGFIADKSVEGKPIKALELPGLWNGAMEYWNTLFVEVPSSTFCPVKSVSDLLKPLHLSGKE